MLLREGMGEDYSDVPEVRSLEYREPPRSNFLPGIRNVRGFVAALEKTGYDKFKMNSCRCPASQADLQDSWMDLKKYGWYWSRTWDTSKPGFNEIYLFYKK